MKKIFILIITFTLILITGSNTFAIDTYGYNLNMPLSEFNGYSLREVFENRNQGMPDLDGKVEISTANYRLLSQTGFSIDYNIHNGEYKIHGTTGNAINLTIFNVLPDTQYTISYIAISGTISGGIIIGVSSPFMTVIQQINENINKQNTFTTTTQTVLRFDILSGRTFDNFTFKLQLESGSTATPYQVPTNGPYSDVDVGQFGLTLQQIEYYFDIYIQLQVPYYNTFFDNIIISINNITNHAESTIQQTFDYLYDGENLTHSGQIITIFFSTALIASILILFFRSWRF